MLGLITCEPDAHHDHADDPKEDDVIPSLQQGCGVKLVEVRRLVGPAHRREGKQA